MKKITIKIEISDQEWTKLTGNFIGIFGIIFKFCQELALLATPLAEEDHRKFWEQMKLLDYTDDNGCTVSVDIDE